MVMVRKSSSPILHFLDLAPHTLPFLLTFTLTYLLGSCPNLQVTNCIDFDGQPAQLIGFLLSMLFPHLHFIHLHLGLAF